MQPFLAVSLSRRILCTLIAMSSLGQNAFADAGVTDNTILIGQTIGITGQIAGSVKEMTEGANAYFKYINKIGGIHGRKIELITLDDKFDPKLSASNARILIKEKKVFALFQSRGTPHTQAILPLLAAEKVPLIGPATGAMVMHQPFNPYVFNVRNKYQIEVQRGMAHFSSLGITSLSLAYVNDSFGQDVLQGFNAGLLQLNLKATTTVSFDRVKPDIDTTVNTLLAANPKVIIIGASGTTTADLIRTLRARGSLAQIMTLSNNAAQSFIGSLGQYAPGVIMTQVMADPYSQASVIGREFHTIAVANGVATSYSAMEGFTSAKVLVEGLRRGGKNLTRESLMYGLESLRNTDLGGFSVNFNARSRSGSEYVNLTMINREGRYIQ